MRSSFALPLAAAVALACANGHAGSLDGEARAYAEARGANPRSPVPPSPNDATLELELRGQWRWFNADALLQHQHLDNGHSDSRARFNELYASTGLGRDDAWHASAGKKIVSWDVGYAWRPNDLVQRQQRLQLVTTTPEGRTLLQLERFDADSAFSLVALPHDLGDERALAARLYRRSGAIDWHGFARYGERTHGSVGAAVAWVVNESIELHGSWHHDLSKAQTQALAGLTWTNAEQVSVIAEAWHDGSVPRRGDPRASNVRQDSVFLRVSWQHEGWTPALDLLCTPQDAGHTATASLAWQGDRLKLEGGARFYGGPSTSLIARAPQRRTAYLLASYAF
jgi:hypothetical protein